MYVVTQSFHTDYCSIYSLKDLLQNMGDNFKDDEIRQVWKEAPISGGQFDYNAFVTLIKRGNQDELAA